MDSNGMRKEQLDYAKAHLDFISDEYPEYIRTKREM
jgi:hypothetical protein